MRAALSKTAFVLLIVAMLLTAITVITLSLTDHVDVLQGIGVVLLCLFIVGGFFFTVDRLVRL